MAEEKKGKGWIIFIIVLVILIVVFFLLSTWQVPYVVKENYQEQEPYQTTESYTEQVSTSGCDNVAGCSCLHYSWLGLGACDSCNCIKYRTVTDYRTVTKQRDTTQYCSALNRITGNC